MAGYAPLIRSPGLRRIWARNLAILASSVLIIPLWDWLSRSIAWTWLGVLVLASISAALFRWRQNLRAIFFVPLIYLAGLAAVRFRTEGNDGAFAVAGAAFFILCVAWLLAEAFWSPFADDLAEMDAFNEPE